MELRGEAIDAQARSHHPMSLNDIQAYKDQLRAEFAIELRIVEVALEKAKAKATRELIEANKRRVQIAVPAPISLRSKASCRRRVTLFACCSRRSSAGCPTSTPG